ncbi:MAG TPA: hypothetical protein VFT04_04065 [Gemmatimonadales bacterium]|nr:hypothetical protein [Gemmatimonadales bacterium]
MTWIRAHAAEASANPLALLRVVAGALLLGATLVALGLAVAGLGWRGLELAGICWALYGLVLGIVAMVDAGVDDLAAVLQSVALMRAGGGFSEIETLEAQGRFAEAADAYLERARSPRDRVGATLRRAAVLGGPLGDPHAAVQSLLDLRAGALTPAEDISTGLALVDLYDYRLNDSGRAMTELRRLIDEYPDARHQRRLRRLLADLKESHFGDVTEGKAR